MLCAERLQNRTENIQKLRLNVLKQSDTLPEQIDNNITKGLICFKMTVCQVNRDNSFEKTS